MSFTNPYPASRLSVDTANSLANGLVAFYPLTDGTGSTAKDITSNANDGTVGGTTTWESSSIGSVLSFDGSTGRSDASVSLSGMPVTLAAWFKVPNTNPSDQCVVSIADSSVADNQLRMIVDGPTGVLEASSFDGTVQAAIGTTAINDNAWHFGVVVFESSTSRKVYVDGVLEATNTSTQTITALDRLSVGVTGDSTPTAYCAGDIQNVRVYNRALSATEVATLFNRPWEGTNYGTLWPYSPPAPADATLSTDTAATSLMSGCVGWWTLTDGSGTTAVDVVGTNDATAGGTVTWESTSNGAAALFDGTGNGYFDIGTDLVGAGDYTISAWVNVDADAVLVTVYCSVSTGTFSYQDLFYINSTTLGYDTPPYGGGITAAFSAMGQGWKHVAIVASSGTWHLYGDGELLSTATQESYSGTNTTNYYIGYRNASWQFDGNIQNVRIWNRALSQDEITLLYERPFEGIEYGDAFHYDPPTPANLTPLTSDSINTDQVLWVPLTETDDYASGAADISGSGNGGTITGSVTSEPSTLGTAADFDSTGDYITTGLAATYDTRSEPLSASVWVKASSQTHTQRILSPRPAGTGSATKYPLVLWVLNTGYVRAAAYDGSGSVNCDSGVVVDDGSWHNITASCSSGTLTLYVDGVEQSTANIASLSSSTSQAGAFKIGQGSNLTSSQQYIGQIQNVRIWERVLSADEIWSIYANPWLGSAYSDAAAVAFRYLINGFKNPLIGGGLVR